MFEIDPFKSDESHLVKDVACKKCQVQDPQYIFVVM